jgi:hypothetical protein
MIARVALFVLAFSSSLQAQKMNSITALFLLLPAMLIARDEENAASGDRERFLTVLEKNFATWDADHDGVLTAKEINKLLA